MKICLDEYIYTMQMWKSQIEGFGDFPQIVRGIDKKNEDNFRVYWGGLSIPGAPSVILETGFFWQAAHLDTTGLYQHSSLCTPQALREIEKFQAPESAADIVFGQKQFSKYSQGEDPEVKGNDFNWSGVVLALQNPVDRSIRSVTSPANYYKFVKDACKFYGDNLFIKLHPWNSGEKGDKLRAIAEQYGCRAAKINHRIIEKCKFVLVFNSTFSVDCMLRGIPVAQYAPGYFYQNPAVAYAEYTFPTEIKTDIEFGRKTCDFLIWRYCFDHSMPAEKWVRMFEHFSKSKKLFPMTEEFCYAANVD